MVKIKLGGHYRTEAGEKIGPMLRAWCGGGRSFSNGDNINDQRRWLIDGACDFEGYAVIAEWQDEPAEVIGENVRAVMINAAPDELFDRMAETRCKPYENDPVSQPPHYRAHPSGIECIQITEHMGFNLGNAIKYIWRCDLKQDAVEDLKKAAWYIQREIAKREKQ